MCASGPWRRLNNKWVSGWYGPWRDMASGLLLSSSTKVLMNGIPGATIQHRRGLCQGDPLSPMFFILAMDDIEIIPCPNPEDKLVCKLV
jgi:hypothetical protein